MGGVWELVADAPSEVVAAAGAESAVLLATANGLFRSMPHGGFERLLAGSFSCVATRGEAIVAAGGGNVWCSDDAGATWTSPPPLPMPDDAAPHSRTVTTALSIDPDGGLWAAARFLGLSMYPVDVGGPTPMLHSAHVEQAVLYRSDDRTAWRRHRRCRANGVAFRGEDLIIATDAGLLIGDRVRVERECTCVAVEASGRIVAGTRGPAFASKEDRFLAIGPTYRDETGVVNDSGHFSALVCGPSGRVFGATRGLGLAGVFLLDDCKKLRWLGRNAGLLHASAGLRSGLEVTALAITGDGTGWAATARHGLFRRAGLDR